MQDMNNADIGFSIIGWNDKTLNTPKKEEVMEASEGITLSFIQDNVWGIQFSLAPGSTNFCYRTKSSIWSKWNIK